MPFSSDIFGKTIDKVKFSDLLMLQQRRVAEGLFVEYKSDFPTSKKIAHSIASFANSHGGWYFIGIESNNTNLPVNFNGFDLSRHKKPIEQIRNIIVSNVNPIPLFYSKIIKRPNNRAILLVHIPDSDETPHITLDGKIYRRNAEGSDPVYENDRYTIDRLYEKGKKLDAICNDFFINEFPITSVQKHQGWLEIYCVIYPVGSLFLKRFRNLEYLEKLRTFINSPTKLFGKKISIGINFDVIEASEDSIIFRQIINKERLGLLTLTFQIFRNGNAKIMIPLQMIDPESLADEHAGRFLLKSVLNDEDYERALAFNESIFKFIDGIKMFISFICLLGKYIEIVKKEKWGGDLLLHYKVKDCFRHIFWFENEEFVEYIRTWGPPICLRNEFNLPGKIERNYFKEKVPRINTGFLSHFVYILLGFGLLVEPANEVLAKSLKDYLKAHTQTQKE